MTTVVFFVAAVAACTVLIWFWRRYGSVAAEKAAADDVLGKLYGRYCAELRALTQTRMLEAPPGDEWLATVKAQASAAASDSSSRASRPEPVLRHAAASVPGLAAAMDATPTAVGVASIAERYSSFGGPARGDSAYGCAGSRSELPALPASPQPWPKVSVVIPTLNEARNLPHVFAKLPAGLHEVIIVDGNSVDDTVATARELRPDVQIVMQNRSGKGNALACGFAAATGDIIAMIDADGSADPAEIPQFVKALLEGADFAKGTRFAAGGGSCDITRLRRLGNRMLSGLVNTLCRTRYSDLCYGYNAFWRRYVPVFGLDVETDVPAVGGTRLWGDGFEVETLINIRIVQADLKVTEVPSYEHSRIHGVNNLNPVRDGWRVLRTILAERYYQHDRQEAQRKLAAELAAQSPGALPGHCHS
jgi:Glycosyl transferase family 2